MAPLHAQPAKQAKPVTDRKSTPIRLFAAHLPETTDAMIPGGVYAMVAETPAARFSLLASSLAGAAEAHTAATLVVSSDPKKFLSTLSRAGFAGADQAIDTGALQVFAQQDNFNKKMFRYGAEAFVKELNHFELAEHSYLVIDQAEHPRSLNDISVALEQAEALAEWAQERKITVLLVFSRQAAMPGSLATLTGALENLAGIVRLSRRPDKAEDGFDVNFEYWQSPDSTIAAKTYAVDVQAHGHYSVKPVAARALAAMAGRNVADATQIEELEPDEPAAQMRYLYTDPALAMLGRQVSGLWQACDSIVGVIRSALGARAPSVLLTFGRQTVLRDLANAVHTLRLALGRRARLVVIERDAVLRYQNEILLLRLGTSLVVHRGVQEDRIPLMLESLQGHVFNNNIDLDFDAALASVVTSSKRGYLPPTDFLRETLGILDRSALLKLPCALVVASADGSQACTDLLTQLRITRAGDLTTTDGKRCFIFFSGCPESSIERALQGVLGESGGATGVAGSGKAPLFTALKRVADPASLRERLATLAHDVRGKNFPETLLPAPPESPSPVAVGSVEPAMASPTRADSLPDRLPESFADRGAAMLSQAPTASPIAIPLTRSDATPGPRFIEVPADMAPRPRQAVRRKFDDSIPGPVTDQPNGGGE